MSKSEVKTFLELLAEMPDYRKGNAIQHKLGNAINLRGERQIV